MENICDICGSNYQDGNNFCGGCGVDLRENNGDPITMTTKKAPKTPKRKKVTKNNPSEDTTITWCQIHSLINSYELTFPIFVYLLTTLASGNVKLGFCDCSVCNLGYRELQTEIINYNENKKLKPSSREIVSKYYGADLSTIKLNLSALRTPEAQEDEDEIKVHTSDDTSKTKHKISIEIDNDMLECLILKVLSSEDGQKLIKKCQK